MRRVVVLALLAMVLPIAAWADGIDITNQFGTVSVLQSGITSKGAQLTSFNGIQAPKGHALGSVSFTTGALLSGSILGGGVFDSTGSTFTVIGKGNSGVPKGVIFSGTFVGPINWTLISHTGTFYQFKLTGDLEGMLYTGHMVKGSTTQYINSHDGQIQLGKGHMITGGTQLGAPEPGTLGLLGTGLVGIAGMFRRKKMAA